MPKEDWIEHPSTYAANIDLGLLRSEKGINLSFCLMSCNCRRNPFFCTLDTGCIENCYCRIFGGRYCEI